MAATTTQGMVNGVDVALARGTIRAVEGKPDLAAFRFRATNRWILGGHNRSTIEDFHEAVEDASRKAAFVLDNDEPDVLLGTDREANPVEHMLHALAGCLTTSMVYHAAARGIRLEEVESSLEGDLDLRGFLGMSDDVRNGYQNVRVRFRVKADATQAEIDELARLAQAQSPVFDIVSNSVPVSVTAVRSERGPAAGLRGPAAAPRPPTSGGLTSGAPAIYGVNV